MNDFPPDSDDTKLDDAIDSVCREFELAWHKNPDFRIEDFVDELLPLVQPFHIDMAHEGNLQAILDELIFVEMELRANAHQEVDQADYLDRFPKCNKAVRDSIRRLRKLYPEVILKSTELTRQEESVSKENEDEDDEPEFVAASNDVKIPEKLGPFREITRINAGAFGIVCRAVDTRTGRLVALKFPRETVTHNKRLLKLFKHEAEAAISLSHPGIVKTHAVKEIDGLLFIVQDFVDGSNLKQVIADREMNLRDSAKLISKIADALAHAHQHQIFHRDLKPANILIDRLGNPFIADFGLAIHHDRLHDAIGQRCGTHAYMSPEVVQGRTHHIDGRSDIWSLGIIFYRLLVGQLPFRGKTEAILFGEIEDKDPRSPRELDPTIDRELERICLKCLEKKARDRYLTAMDLTEQLRDWLERPTQFAVADKKAAFIPKGLRSYGIEDAAFFQRLLPGPRDRDGLPASIRFWSVRICEPVAPENKIPVGVIYGPSGSGKSSFVKAGLIPQIQAHVDTIYVESTQSDTEVRLIKALRQRFEEIPKDFALPDILEGLRKGLWKDSKRKIVIVIDQFEQRLSVADDFNQSQIAKALRHCDGHNLQCILLVRDDFWLALTRFSDALEMDLREGHNSQDIDLFDRAHAKKVLVKLGRAYDRLPSPTTGLSLEQNEFLEESIRQLSVNNYVICVRLTLFAEMFKSRPWTLAELKAVGGVHGVGEKFLESTFGAESTARRFQIQKKSVQAVLEALLPDAGSDIRGAMKSEQWLTQASGMNSQPERFKTLINTLDEELRLVTRTDPDSSGNSETDSNRGNLQGGHFQLTHDYLVPSIRNWLTTDLRSTRRGRAKLRLKELASQVEPGKAAKYKPTNFEWLTWQYLLRNETKGEKAIAVMRAGRSQFWSSFGKASAALILVFAVFSLLFSDVARRRAADTLVRDLLGHSYDRLPQIVDQMVGYENLVRPRLLELETSATDADQRNRIQLGLLPFEPERTEEIAEYILKPDCGPEELRASLGIVMQRGNGVEPEFTRCLNDDSLNPRSRFRAAVALCQFGQPDLDWQSFSGSIGAALIREPATTRQAWIELLLPIAKTIRSKFREMLVAADAKGDAETLAQALYAFTDPENRASVFSEIVVDSNDAQFDAILSTFENNHDQPGLLEAVRQRTFAADNEPSIAIRAITMFRLGEPAPFKKLLADKANLGIRSHAIILANPNRINFSILRDLYSSVAKNEPNSEPLLVQGLLMGFAERVGVTFDDQQLKWLDNIARTHCLDDRDAGCFAAAELIDRRRGGDNFMTYRKQRRESPVCKEGVLGSVFINAQHQAFSIFDIDDETLGKYKIAVSMTEVTYAELSVFFENSGLKESNANRPHIARNLPYVLEYFEFLNKTDRIAASEEKPDIDDGKENGISIKSPLIIGYRFMTEAEWSVIGGRQQATEWFLGKANILANHYAWTTGNTDNSETKVVASLLPDSQGLFDIYGNANELCSGRENSQNQFLVKGQSVREPPASLSPTSTYEIDSAEFRNFLVGIRPCKKHCSY